MLVRALAHMGANGKRRVTHKKSVDGDLNFSANGGSVHRIRFAGVSDSGWLAYHAHDSTANNPWYGAASTQNSILKLGVGGDIGIHADSVRIEGCAGIYLKVADRVISSAKIEARGGVDVLGNAIATTGAVTCGSLNAGSVSAGAGAIHTTGTLAAGT
jgi:hypothetical protein